jgi:hypothetical protein
MAGIHEEERVTEGLTWKEAMLPVNRWRIGIVITLQMGTKEMKFLLRTSHHVFNVLTNPSQVCN